MKEKPVIRNVATNRRARHVYDIVETCEAGIELKGCEVKSLRAGWVDLAGSYAELEGRQLFLCKAHIKPYQASPFNPPAERRRRLLMHRGELDRMAGRLSQRGMTLVPLRVFFGTRGWAKVELGLAKGKKSPDRRDDMKKRDAEREMRRVRGV